MTFSEVARPGVFGSGTPLASTSGRGGEKGSRWKVFMTIKMHGGRSRNEGHRKRSGWYSVGREGAKGRGGVSTRRGQPTRSGSKTQR